MNHVTMGSPQKHTPPAAGQDEHPKSKKQRLETSIYLSSVSSISVESDTLTPNQSAISRPKIFKRRRCGKCKGCLAEDCRECKNCLDMPKYGGIGRKNKACLKRPCELLTKGKPTAFMTNSSGDSEMIYEGANRSASDVVLDQDTELFSEETDDDSEEETLPQQPGTSVEYFGENDTVKVEENGEFDTLRVTVENQLIEAQRTLGTLDELTRRALDEVDSLRAALTMKEDEIAGLRVAKSTLEESLKYAEETLVERDTQIKTLKEQNEAQKKQLDKVRRAIDPFH